MSTTYYVITNRSDSRTLVSKTDNEQVADNAVYRMNQTYRAYDMPVSAFYTANLRTALAAAGSMAAIHDVPSI